MLAFIACGDGGCEAMRLLGFMGLSNISTMAKWSFGQLEEQIGPKLVAVTEEALRRGRTKTSAIIIQLGQDNSSMPWVEAAAAELMPPAEVKDSPYTRASPALAGIIPAAQQKTCQAIII